MPEKDKTKISTEQKRLIAGQLASFFFDFWQKRNNKSANNVFKLVAKSQIDSKSFDKK